MGAVSARLYHAGEAENRRLRALQNERGGVKRYVHLLREGAGSTGAFAEIIGSSRGLLDALQQAELVAPADTTVLLLGETGTGKELLARAIHERSRRAGGVFVAVNCAALPPTLVESELFGHEKGAFTGALTTKIGKYEVAHRGTLFLDEIGDLPVEAQAKLLRVLQNGELQRVGGTQSIRVDARVIAATNQDLALAMSERRFRQDLYFRLSPFPICIPPLRDRMEDVALLARHFVRLAGAKIGKAEMQLQPCAVDRLMRYEWPGNVRELANVLERAVILAGGRDIGPELIGPPTPIGATGLAPAQEPIPLAEAERRAILTALAKTNWRLSGRQGAAELLDLKPTTLHAKMRRLGIRRPPKPALPPN